MKKFFIVNYVLLFFTTLVFSQIKIYNYVDKNKVHFGNILSYKVIIQHKGNIEVSNFDIYNILKDTSGVENFILFNTKVTKRKSLFTKKVTVKYIFYLIPVKIGKLTIGEIQVNALNKQNGETVILKIPQVEVEVIPYPKPKNKKFDGTIIDIKNQIWIRNYLWLILLLSIVIIISAWILYQYKLKPVPQQQTQEQQLNPVEVALNRLEELWSKNYLDQGLIKEFYLELSNIVRWYIEQKYNVNAMELTTEELFNVLKKKTDKKYNLTLKSFLDNADLAKFAKYIPERQQIEIDFETAKKLCSLGNF